MFFCVFYGKKKSHPIGWLSESGTAQQLLRVDGFDRAHVGAGAAIGADFRVDLVDVAFGNGLDGTFIDAGPASCAIFIYFISHDD